MGASDEKGHVGSFAEGERTLPHSGADHAAGHFSEGSETDHAALAAVVGNFSEGVLASHAAHEKAGSFGDVDCPVCRAMSEASNRAM
jgi:hypothetical protein